jgi:hypothetical protein
MVSTNALSVATPATSSAMAWCTFMKNPPDCPANKASPTRAATNSAGVNGARRQKRTSVSSPGGAIRDTTTCSAISNDGPARR